jgi:hypothetical protein
MSGETVPFDTMLDALSDIERRTLLVALLEHNPQDDSPRVIGDGENGRDTVGELVRMDHGHLPKLAEYGLIEWDRENDEVHRGRAFGEIRPLLELLDSHRDELPEGWT